MKINDDEYNEVSFGELAKEGDVVLTPLSDIITLTIEESILHNQFEPNGYSADSYKRYRKIEKNIYYSYDTESWEDKNDIDFSVSMTPENSEDLNLTFSNQEEFFKWYNS